MILKQAVAIALVLAQISCSSPAVPKGVVAKEKDEKQTQETGFESVDPEVDILFIVDNSGSMSTHQQNLSANIDKFLANFLTKTQVDFHFGVITTDSDKLIGRPNFVDKNTPGFQAIIKNRLLVGINGSGTEMIFDPLYSALSEPNLSGLNNGFLRKGASLAVVIVTDAEDQSTLHQAMATFQYLVKLKGAADKVLSYGVIVPSSEWNCERDMTDQVPLRIESFLSLSSTAGSNSLSLCAPDFGTRLSELGQDLAKRVSSTVFLSKLPIVETIEVKFGNRVVPADPKIGWVFNPGRNTITFGPEMDWASEPQGSKVSVKYDFTEFSL